MKIWTRDTLLVSVDASAPTIIFQSFWNFVSVVCVRFGGDTTMHMP